MNFEGMNQRSEGSERRGKRAIKVSRKGVRGKAKTKTKIDKKIEHAEGE